VGGLGSGGYRSDRKKTTVEDSHAISVSNFCSRNRFTRSGSIHWKWPSYSPLWTDFVVTLCGEANVMLNYRLRHGQDISLRVLLQKTPTNFESERWWLSCPLTVNGAACNRRVGKLYLPPGARYFGCRKCHDLTYRSSQQAHFMARLPARIATLERRLDTMRNP